MTAIGPIVSIGNGFCIHDCCVCGLCDATLTKPCVRTTGMHGDWVVGYYVNLYYLSSHVKDPDFAGEPRVRIEGTLGMIKGGTYGNCIHGDVERCDETAHVCHRQTALSMANRTREIAASSPGTFRNFP